MPETLGFLVARESMRRRVGLKPCMVFGPDPRRPGKPLVLVTCWCGRNYTLTGEAVKRHAADRSAPCPEDCGKGAE